MIRGILFSYVSRWYFPGNSSCECCEVKDLSLSDLVGVLGVRGNVGCIFRGCGGWSVVVVRMLWYIFAGVVSVANNTKIIQELFLVWALS